MTTIVRTNIAHTPRNPFACEGALDAFEAGAPALVDRRVVGCREYGDVRAGQPEADVLDAGDTIPRPGFVDDRHVGDTIPRPGFVDRHVGDTIPRPGFADRHVHHPQIRMIGARVWPRGPA